MARRQWIWLAPVVALAAGGCAGNCDPNTTQGLAAGACLVRGDDGGFSGRQKEKQQQLADLKLRNTELKGEIAETETELYAVQDKRQAAERRQAEQQRKLAQLKKREAASAERNADLERQIAELEKDLARANNQTSDLGAEERALERKIANLRNEEQALQADIDAVSSTR